MSSINIVIRIIKLFFVFFFAFLISLFPANIVHADTFTLSGTILDNNNNAVGNATITVTGATNGAQYGSTISDPTTGSYSISNLPGGTVKIQVVPLSSSGFQSTTVTQTISADTQHNFVLVPGQPLVTVSGNITANGNPVSGINVNGVVTNSSGHYSFTQPPGRSLTLALSNTTSNQSLPFKFTANITIPNTTVNADATLDVQIPVKTFTVNVQDVNSQPIANTTINIYQPGGNGSTTRVPITFNTSLGVVSTSIYPGSGTFTSGPTNQSGIYTTQVVAGGPYEVQFIAPSINYVSDKASLTFTSDLTYPVTLQDQQLVTISGNITAGGNPVSGIDVNGVVTNNAGHYSFIQVAGRSLQLSLSNASSNQSLPIKFNANITVPNTTVNSDTTLDVQIPVNTLTVNAQDVWNHPIANTTINVYPPGGNGSGVRVPVTFGTSQGSISTTIYPGSGVFTTGPTNQSGTYSTPIITGGPYEVQFISPNNNYISSKTSLTISSDLIYPFTLQPKQLITISGHITAGGNAVAGITVNGSTTDNSGYYSFSQAPGGPLELALTNNATNQSLPINFNTDITVPNITVNTSTTLDVQIPVKTFTANVQDSNEQPLSNSTINVYPPGGNGSTTSVPVTFSTSQGSVSTIIHPNYSVFSTGETGQNGIYSTQIIAGGPYEIQLVPPSNNYLPSTTSLTVTSDINQTYSLQYSHSAPVTTAVLATDRGDGTYSNPTTVTLSATAADGYTVATTYYKVDGGAQQPYTAPFTVSGAQEHTIQYWSVDNSGVQEQIKTKTFTIAATYNLSGIVYVDANQNAVQDEGEQGYAGATLGLNAGLTATTDTTGSYTFANVVSGSYVETLTVPTGYMATTTNPVTIALGANTTQNFGIAPVPTNTPIPTDTPTPTPPDTPTPTPIPTYTITGNVYVDANRNGVKDTGEIDYQGATLNLSGAGIDTTTTNGSGNYAFTNKIAGTYAVTLVLPNEYEVTTANPVDVPLSSNTTVNFGIALIVVPTDTPTPTITPEPDQLTSLQPAKVWIGRKNNQYHDATAKYDLKAEVYKNGTLITSGVLSNVSAGNPGWAGANLQTIPFNSFSAVSLPVGTELSIKVSVKNNCSSPISISNPRIWFNDSAANSSFGATIDGTNRNYYLLINSALATLVGEGPKQTADVTTDVSCSVYKPFGTWSVNL